MFDDDSDDVIFPTQDRKMKPSSLGFTLVELLVAMSLFSIMTVMAYGGLSSVLTTREHVDQASEQLHQLQRVFLFLQQDLYHLSAQQTGFYGGSVTKGAGDIMRFTRSVSHQASNPAFLSIRYQINQGNLTRHLQSRQGLERSMQLFEGIKGFSIQFFHQKWHDSWPPSGLNKGETWPIFPEGVKLEINSQHWGKVTRILSLQ